MPLSTIIHNTCKSCGKVAVEVSRVEFGDSKLITLACGHVVSEDVLSSTNYDSVVSSDNRKLRPFQVAGVQFVEKSNARCLIADEQGLGKAQSVDSKILTSKRWKRMGDIIIGDEVISNDGKSYPVTAIFPQGLIECYQINFNDDSSTTCSPDHLWDVKSPNDVNRGRAWRTMKTSELLSDLHTGQGYPKWMIPITSPVELPALTLPIEPYQLGCLLGDGCFRQNQIGIASIDEEIYNKFPYHRHDKITYFLPSEWWHKIKDLGLYFTDSESKFIPEIYKFNSIQNRLALLRGLMDTDGSIWNNGVVEYTTVSPKLAAGVMFLVESLGGTSKLSSKIGSYTKNGQKIMCKKVYRIVINLPMNPFQLNRKSSLWKPRDKYKPNRYVRSIEYLGLKECQCITVDSPSHLYLTDNCIVTHNTVQACASLRLHFEDLTPAVVITKSTIKLQWMWEIIRWTNSRKVQVIQSSKEKAIPGFDVYVVTYDMVKSDTMFDYVNPKTIIVDECQAIKNHLSGRAKAVQKLASKAEHIIALSGTPIKNHAGEYFTILNILQPSRFPTYQGYLDRFCDNYFNGYGHKVGGLSQPELFRELTDDFIIRRTKAEVLPELPALSRNFHHVELNKKFNSAYANAQAELDELFYADEDENTMTNMIAVMTKMRQICGLSKVSECVDFVTDHLLSTDRKIVIFVHHHSVANLLQANLDTWLAAGGFGSSLNLTSSLSGDARSQMVREFETDASKRVMIASTLAAGEGLNLQFCSDVVMLERQWNPANEEQAEGRFHRFGQLNPVNVVYMLATETIDEKFTELVEQKRAIVAATMDGQTIAWDQSSLVKELASILVAKGVKKWTL